MATCPHCKEQIEDGAIKCPHCGLRVRGLIVKIESIKPFVELFALIAAVIVLVFMYWQNSIMNNTLNQMKEDMELQKVYLQPRLFIKIPEVSISDNILTIKYPIDNLGQTDAESIFVSVVCKMEGRKDLSSTKNRCENIMRQSGRYFILDIEPVFKHDFMSKIEVDYSWPQFNKHYTERRYFVHKYDKGKFNSYQIIEQEVKKVWF